MGQGDAEGDMAVCILGSATKETHPPCLLVTWEVPLPPHKVPLHHASTNTWCGSPVSGGTRLRWIGLPSRASSAHGRCDRKYRLSSSRVDRIIQAQMPASIELYRTVYFWYGMRQCVLCLGEVRRLGLESKALTNSSL